MRSELVTTRRVKITANEMKLAIKTWIEEKHDPLIVIPDGYTVEYPGTKKEGAILEFVARTEDDAPGQVALSPDAILGGLAGQEDQEISQEDKEVRIQKEINNDQVRD